MNKISGYFVKNGWLIILTIILLVSTFLKVAEVKGYNFPFTTDQGRDMVDMRHMVVTHTPRLVGPTTSINGVLLGPTWYYFNLIPFVLGKGDPAFIVYWQIFWYQLSVITLWLVLRRKNANLAGIVSLFLLLMPTGFNTARYFWNANSMPFFTTFYFAILIWTLSASSSTKLFFLGLVAGIGMQIEVAFGILLFPFAILYLLLFHSGPKAESVKIKFKKTLPLITGFGATLLPQVLFELKHGFIMTKILLNEVMGRGDMLGEKISLADRLIQRKEHLLDLVHHSSHLPPNTMVGLFILGVFVYLFYFLKKRPGDREFGIWSLSFYFILFSAVFYILFPQKLKIWYTLGLSIPLVLFLGSFFQYLLERKLIIFKAVAIGLLIMTIYYSVKSQVDYTRDVAFKASDDRSNMKNELAAIDWIYSHAEGKGFNVYSYLPSVYDFPYNHLFWWYGNRKYGYEPADTAYLPSQPEYIRDVNKLWTNRRSLDSKSPLTFLIIEEDFDMPSRTVAWLGNFSKLCLVKEVIFPWHAKVRMMTTCNQ